jgi:hypothetical protein
MQKYSFWTPPETFRATDYFFYALLFPNIFLAGNSISEPFSPAIFFSIVSDLISKGFCKFGIIEYPDIIGVQVSVHTSALPVS